MDILEQVKSDLIKRFLEAGRTKEDAVLCYNIIIQTYEDYLEKYQFPNVLENTTAEELLEHLKESGEQDTILKKALVRIGRIDSGR